MPTRPKHDPAAIAADARPVLAAAREDQSDATFRARIGRRELDTAEANIVALEHGDGAQSNTLHVQVAAGVHVATARAALFALFIDVRDDAKLAFKDAGLLHDFGVGANVKPDLTAAVRAEAEALLDAAHRHPHEAASVGLNAHGVHHLEALVHALDGTHLAHEHTVAARHTSTTALDSLAHLVSAETAHIRLAAQRAFRGDEARLARYATTLPRHTVTPRARPPAAPATPATPAT